MTGFSTLDGTERLRHPDKMANFVNQGGSEVGQCRPSRNDGADKNSKRDTEGRIEGQREVVANRC